MSETTSSNGIDMDGVFAVLANERRRLILEYLLTRGSSANVPELVDRLVMTEQNGHERSRELRERIVMSLHHVHLPKLDDSNLVDFDPGRGEVVLREGATAVEPCLELARG